MPPNKNFNRHNLNILNMNVGNIPSNPSHQELVNSVAEKANDNVENIGFSGESHRRNIRGRLGWGVTKRQWITVAILCFVNLINYMDRFTLAGVMTDIQTYYNIGDDMAGLLQTAFVISYMIFAPLFGYLGDRYSRKFIMAFGVFFWSLTTLLGSFMKHYSWFLLFRALVGVGEASYSTIAPTIISDLFVKDMRSKMLALFYFGIPVGSGLGYIIGSETAKAAGAWQWGLRVTPVMGAVAVVLILCPLVDPPRGGSEGGSHLSPTNWTTDIKDLCKNRSFMLSTLGFTCVAFVAGALAWWGPKFITLGLTIQKGGENVQMSDVSYVFGVIAMVAGLTGVPLGSFLAQRLRSRYPRADPLVCALGMLISTPFMFLGAVIARYNTAVCYTLIFFGQLFLNMNWSLVADILLYVVMPTRRSTAEAFQILLSHMFGDAGSPYIIGQVSEVLKVVLRKDYAMMRSSTSAVIMESSEVNTTISYLVQDETLNQTPDSVQVDFHSLQYALFITCFVEVIGGLFFLITALYIVQDRAKAERAITGDVVMDDGHVAQPTHLYADDPLIEQTDSKPCYLAE